MRSTVPIELVGQVAIAALVIDAIGTTYALVGTLAGDPGLVETVEGAMKATSEIDIYERDGVEIKGVVDRPKVTVESHWNIISFAVLIMPDGERYTIDIGDLERALRNARNVR